MSTSVVVHRVATGSLPLLEAAAWRAELLSRRARGERPLTLYGERSGALVTLTAALRGPDGAVSLVRGVVTAEAGYHSLTSDWPALHCFERELHEQTGVRLAGHPWLKPVRYERGEQSAMNAHPFYVVEGKEVHEVAVGPIHAGVIEPGSFRFMCHGEQVQHLEIQLGYQHRGVEACLLEGDPRRRLPWVETIAGDSSVAHAWAYCAALESLSGARLSIQVEMARAVVLELERVAMHLAGLSGLSADVGFLQGATSYGRLRTTAINTTMRLCGSRFGRGALTPGGTRLRLTAIDRAEVEASLQLLRSDLPIINDCFLAARSVRHRLAGVGVLTEEQARELGLVGLAARASGVSIDARQGMPHGAYHALPIRPQALTDGDCLARARLRILEMDASLDWLSAALATGDAWEQPSQAVANLSPSELVVSLVEGWRGEVVHCLETDAAGGLAHYKVQDPSLRNWMGLAVSVRLNEISDFPICNKSFDLSYAGNDL